MVGCVGADAFGPVLLDSLHQAGVNIESVLSLPEPSTGTATIIVEDSGENRIIIVPGANGCVNPRQIDELWPEIQQSDTILLQFEIPLETVFHVIRRAHHDGIRVIVNPAPAYKIPADVLSMITCLIVNEKETAMISRQPVSDVDSAFAAAEALNGLGVETVIITLGAAGAVLFNGTGQRASTNRPIKLRLWIQPPLEILLWAAMPRPCWTKNHQRKRSILRQRLLA